MLAIVLVAAFVAQEPTDYRALAAIKPEVVAAHVRACGFRHARVADDAVLQEDVVKVADTVATQNQLRCAARASLASVYYVVFRTPIERRYRPIYYALERTRAHTDAVAWLAKRGLLAKLPKFDPTRSADLATARAIEAVCGPKAAGALEPQGEFVTIAPPVLATGSLDDGTLECLMRSAEATGYPLGFIGNEAYRKDK